MESIQSQSDSFPQEAKEVLAASLFLSICKYTNPHASKGIEHAVQWKDVAASGSRAPTHEPRDSDAPIVRAVNALIDSIGECHGPFEKKVEPSDVSEKQSRLNLPKLHVDRFIKPLLRGKEDSEKVVLVRTFNTAGKAYPMKFKYRSSSKAFVLLRHWKKFVEENQLKPSDVLMIWAFRAVQTGGLCFVISSRSP